jgi:diaminohydroxyphosphoribosylaminopyrimidine deaminase / 5-amino-6-(5-phosphoribosylamino)uracil reductase
MTISGQHAASLGEDDDAAWHSLLRRAHAAPGTLRRSGLSGAGLRAAQSDTADGAGIAAPSLSELYLPLLDIGPTAAIAHLGQSLDGRIATASGASHYVTGEQDILHNHRMRALCDAVLVGAGTVRYDDPQLTVRLCDGPDPVRVVVDTERRLDIGYHIFRDGCAETLLLTAADKADGKRHGMAEVIGVPRLGQGLCPKIIREILAARGLNRVFIEGGGITVSRFLQAGGLDLLQVTIAPLIIGSGRMGISLPEVASLADGIRPPVRYFRFGADLMVECDLRDCRR